MSDAAKDPRPDAPYRVMPNAHLRRGALCVSALQPRHIEAVRIWRNAQMDVLRQAHPITAAAQRAYFETHVWPEKPRDTPRQILLAIAREGTLIGYGGLVHIDWPSRRAEVSFLLKPELERIPSTVTSVFLDFLKIVQDLAFVELALNRLTTETFAHRREHINTLEAAGFRHEGTMREHVLVNGKTSDSLLHGMLASDR
ncbi:MAG: GNAT family N-acetyltransferase [Pseudomonadota bacterium]